MSQEFPAISGAAMLRPLVPVLATLSFALAGCDGAADPAPAASSAAKPEIAVTNARLMLPAVAGNPGAAYFDLANNTDRPVVLTTVGIAGTDRTEMHETKGSSMAQVPEITVAPGARTSFAPGGRHVMVFGAPPRSAAGEIRAMTVTFKDGRKEQVEAKLEAIGAMDHAGGSH